MAGAPFWSEQIRGAGGPRPFIAHPALRLIVFTVLIMIPLAIDTLAPLLILFGYLAAISIYSRVPPALLRTSARTIAPFIILILLLNVLFGHGGGSRLAWHGMARGLVYAARILDLYAAALIYIATTSQEEMARAAALAAPVSPPLARGFALFGFVSFGFLPVFYEEYRRIRIVQRFRGGRIGGGALSRLEAVRALLIPLLISALRRSAQLAMAVELRSVQRSIGVLLVVERPPGADYLWTLVTAGIAGALLLFPRL